MTLETCKKRLELAQSPEEKEFWEERIARKLNKPKYRAAVAKAQEKLKAEKTKEEVKDDGKKPKR